MVKRILAMVLTICILTAALPLGVSAEATQHDALVNQINKCYRNTRYATGESSLSDLCGTFVAYQLYYLDVTTFPEIYNGNQFYRIYSRQEVSSGGHNINLYSAKNYTLEEALNAITKNGTRDVYNVMLCFDWTRYGGGYGHVMLIHAIIDGVVYGVDNFTTSIAGREGKPMIAPIARFVQEYAGWTSFEGAVEFGVKEYASQCPSYATDMFVRMTQPDVMLTQPAPAGSNGSEPVRTLVQGERLEVTDVILGEGQVNYYRVQEEGRDFYVPCANTQPVRFNIEGLQTRNIHLETTQKAGEKGRFTGEIFSTGSLIGKVEMVVTDAAGEEVLRKELQEPRFNHDLGDLKVDYSQLAEGTYAVKLYASLWNYYDNNGVVNYHSQHICVFADTLVVGDSQTQTSNGGSVAPTNSVKHGWLYEDGVWRCYRNGVPRTGWYCYDGVDYYLKEDGSVTTGWVNINGEDRFFSDTGAMRTGWFTEDNGNVRYMLFNGASAKGWREIDGVQYYFDENGILDKDAIPEG